MTKVKKSNSKKDAIYSQDFPFPLAGVRVLDLSGWEASLCSKLLSDLGAEVLKVEKPGEEPAEQIVSPKDSTFFPLRGLYYQYLNAGKLSVTLDMDTAADKERFLKLAAVSDVVIESFPPGHLEAMGLGYETLGSINPEIIMTSITGFGQTGPYSSYKWSDITASASGGQMYICGLPGRSPLKPYGDQSYYTASLFAANGILLALLWRSHSGSGQHIDVSLQEAVTSTLEHVLVRYFNRGEVANREGSLQWNLSSDIFPCRNGYALLTFDREWDTLVELLGQQNIAGNLVLTAWKDMEYRHTHTDKIKEVVSIWTSVQEREELFNLGQSMRFPWAPVNSINDVLSDPQLASRAFFIPAQLNGRDFKAPRPVILFENVPDRWMKAPLAGEHNSSIDEITSKERPSKEISASVTASMQLPLEGVRVLDFTWMLAGPYATRMLADFGAQVIKIQSSLVATGAERNESDYFATWNRNKLGITIDLRRSEARSIVLDLVKKCDVVVENFTPRVMENWGLTYNKLKEARPGLVMVSLSGFGHSGPYRDYAALGPTLQALSGLTALTSYNDGPPCGIGLAYIDHISGLYASLAVLSALHRRDMTGLGAYIDISEYEAACSLLGPSLMDCSLNGNIAGAVGNRSECRIAAPQGCYKCQGEERWCAIAVFSQDEWEALVRLMGNPQLAGDPRFSTLESRLQNSVVLDLLINDWTSQRASIDVMRLLQEAGVPAAAVNDAHDLALDQQLQERNYFVELLHPKLGKIKADGNPIRMSKTPPRYTKSAPLLGEDNKHVMVDILGMDEDLFKRYEGDSVLD